MTIQEAQSIEIAASKVVAEAKELIHLTKNSKKKNIQAWADFRAACKAHQEAKYNLAIAKRQAEKNKFKENMTMDNPELLATIQSMTDHEKSVFFMEARAKYGDAHHNYFWVAKNAYKTDPSEENAKLLAVAWEAFEAAERYVKAVHLAVYGYPYRYV